MSSKKNCAVGIVTPSIRNRLNMLPESTIEGNSISLVAGSEWRSRSFSAAEAEGIVLTPTEAFRAELEATNNGRDPVFSVSVQLLRDRPENLVSLLEAKVEMRKKLDPTLTIESQHCEPNSPECSCLIHYSMLYPLNSPLAKRLIFSLHCTFVKCPAGVLRYDVRARDFYIRQAISIASPIFRTVVVKQ